MRLSAFYCACAFWSCVLALAKQTNKPQAPHQPLTLFASFITHIWALQGASRVEVLDGYSLVIHLLCLPRLVVFDPLPPSA